MYNRPHAGVAGRYFEAQSKASREGTEVTLKATRVEVMFSVTELGERQALRYPQSGVKRRLTHIM